MCDVNAPRVPTARPAPRIDPEKECGTIVKFGVYFMISRSTTMLDICIYGVRREEGNGNGLPSRKLYSFSLSRDHNIYSLIPYMNGNKV